MKCNTNTSREKGRCLLASTIQFSNNHATPADDEEPRPRPRTGGPYPSRSRDPGTQQRAPYHFMSLDILHTTTGGTPAHTTGAQPGAPKTLRRKEVIQPHLPVRLPCYDLVPIADLTLDGSPPKG